MRHSSCYEVLLLVLTHIKAMTPPDLYRHQFAYWRYRSMEAVSSHFLQPFPTGPAKVIGQETAEFSSGFSAIIPHKLVVKINCSSVYGLWTDHNMFEWATTDPRTSSSTQVHRSTARTLHTPHSRTAPPVPFDNTRSPNMLTMHVVLCKLSKALPPSCCQGKPVNIINFNERMKCNYTSGNDKRKKTPWEWTVGTAVTWTSAFSFPSLMSANDNTVMLMC